jgi:hypothetical protein
MSLSHRSVPTFLFFLLAVPLLWAQGAKTSIIIERQLVRFITPGEAMEWRLVVANQQGELIFDSGLVYGSALDWPLKNQQGEAVASGLYTYTLTSKAATEETTRTQRGHLMLARPSESERIWITNDQSASIGTDSSTVKLSVIGSGETTVGGVELPVSAPRREASEERGELPKRASTETATANSKTPATTNFTVNEDLTVNGNLIFTPAPARDITMQNNNTGLRFYGAPTLTNSPAAAAIQFWGNNSNFPGQLYLDAGATDLGALIFRTAPTGGTIAERMRVTANGNVGIGTPSPTSKLEIAAQDGLKITGFQPFLTLHDTSLNRRSILASGSGDFGFYPESFIGGVPAVVIKSGSGNVGIGVTNPTARLQVAAGNTAGIQANSQANAIIGYSTGQGFAAVYGENTTSTSFGVYGKGGSSGNGVFGEGNTGVRGQGFYGVFGTSTATIGDDTTAAGVYGEKGPNCSSCWAGYFAGPVRITDGISAGGVSQFAGDVYAKEFIETSDRNVKANFASVDTRAILQHLAAIPIQTWNFKSQPEQVRHIGPMAQDFRAAFNLGIDDKHIATVDADGVALAAIQGLYQLVQEKEKQLEQQSRQLEQLQSRIAQLERAAKKRSAGWRTARK